MCGINFLHNPARSPSQLSDAVGLMNAATKHRGPDNTSQLLGDNNTVFGFNRLHVVGSEQGRQPITDPATGNVLICNGEIFNHLELRERHLPNRQFSTDSDVEVILHLYREFGTQCLEHLEGQFSFVLMDKSRQTVFLARDRFGINPLFYQLGEQGELAAASEIKSILASQQVAATTLDPQALQEVLLYYGARPPKTCFKGILQIPPAHFALYDLVKKTMSVENYWTLASQSRTLPEDTSPKDTLHNLLEASVERRLQGNATPGVYVSGGLDSSLVASIIAKKTHNRLKLFSIAFRDRRYDESLYQDKLADSLGLNVHKVTLDISDITASLDTCIRHIETPISRSAPVPMMLLSRLARSKGATFVLCGEGADELFAGYPVFAQAVSSFEHKWNQTSRYLSLFTDNAATAQTKQVYNELVSYGAESSRLSQVRKQEITTKLSQYLLISQGDRVSMANGLEQRFPFLDTALAEFAFTLSNEHLIKDGKGKALLRETFKDYLPADLLARKKQGYLAPDDEVVTQLLRDKRYDQYFEKTYFDKVGVFEFDQAQTLIQRFVAGTHASFDPNMILFILTTHMLYEIAQGTQMSS